MFYTIPQQQINKTLSIIDELNTNFPMMTLEDIDFKELEKISNVSEKDFLSMIVMMDYLSKEKVHINMNNIKKVKVNRNKNKWRFIIDYHKHNEPLKFKHTYSFRF